MPTETDLVNRALRLLKAQRITSLSDGSKQANVANDVYDETRDDLLRSHTWNFATKIVKLAQQATAPIAIYDHGYTLPSDWLRTTSVYDNDAGLGTFDYMEAENDGVGAILASADEVWMVYVYQVIDPNRMSADFRTALAYELALSMPGIPNISAAAIQILGKESRRRLIKAKSSDALTSPPPRRPVGSWHTSRQSWPSTRWPR